MGHQGRVLAAERDSVPQDLAGHQAAAADVRACPGKGILWGALISALLWLVLIAVLAPLL
ncbi:MAG: hypothetical protein HPY67_09000 [Syntrophaceae bacterium]|nr:hypothetical protein [Syntrophaceae bacterium]